VRLSRRQLLSVGLPALGTATVGLGTAAFAVGIEPYSTPRIVTRRVSPRHWPQGRRLKLAIVTDVHAGEPGFPLARVRAVVAQVNALRPDLIVLLGDYSGGAGARLPLDLDELAGAFAGLDAPLGRFAAFGNHDYWDGIEPFRAAFARTGVPMLENRAVPLGDGGAFYLAGVASTIAIPLGHARFQGLDDLPGTLASIPGEANVILLAHEPDLFPDVPERVAVTLSGHTHGGQVRLFGWSPVVPSMYGNRFAYGHVVEGVRHLVVGGGLGNSIYPIRFGVPPEITVVELGA
jgi:predicted MPP superfamily phosphohydrolase